MEDQEQKETGSLARENVCDTNGQCEVVRYKELGELQQEEMINCIGPRENQVQNR